MAITTIQPTMTKDATACGYSSRTVPPVPPKDGPPTKGRTVPPLMLALDHRCPLFGVNLAPYALFLRAQRYRAFLVTQKPTEERDRGPA
jgi:hypothetical protein